MTGDGVRAVLAAVREGLAHVGRMIVPLARLLFVLPARGVAACVVLILGVMVWAFALGYSQGPLAWAGYTLCAYAFAVICVAVVRGMRGLEVPDALREIPVVGLLLDDRLLRTLVSVGASLVFDLLWGVANALLGLLSSSVWVVTLGAYYLCLVAMRAFLLWHSRTLGWLGGAATGETGEGSQALPPSDAPHRSEDAKAVARLCRGVGVAVCAMAFPVMGIVILNLNDLGTFSYHMYITIGVAAYSFVSLGVALSGFVRYRGGGDPIMFASSNISLVTALASFLTMGILMINVFSGEGDDGGFRLVMTCVMGAVVTLTILALGIRLVVRSRRSLRGLYATDDLRRLRG